MINSTILKLSIVFLSGSPFSYTPAAGVSSFSIDRSYFSKSLHTLFYFNIFSGEAQIAKTTFDNIIGGAIQVESDYYEKGIIIVKRFSPNIISSNTYTFEKCMFRNCYCTGEKMNGGAVCANVAYSNNLDVDFTFKSSSFYNCRSQGGFGGAFYGYHICDVNILETCFNACFTRKVSGSIPGVGTAVYIDHITSTKRTKGRGSSYIECPKEAAGYPYTESVFFVSTGIINFDYSNFSNNVVEYGSSAICMFSYADNKISFTTCNKCVGEFTFLITGMNNTSCDLNTLNFINCTHHVEAKDFYGIFAILYVKVNIKQSVFIMSNNKILAMRDVHDSSSIITFSKCTFDIAQSDLFNIEICEFIDCSFSKIDLVTNKYSYFNSQECWEIETPSQTDIPSFNNNNGKIAICISIVNSILLVGIIVYLVIKCFLDKKKNDGHASSLSLNESLISNK